MSVLFEWTFGSIFHSLSRTGELAQGNSDESIDDAIERAVDRIHPRLRLVSDYRERLRPAVTRSLKFIDDTVEKIPGSLDINPTTFGADPRVNALFASVDHLYSVCRESAELRAFFERAGGAKSQGCWALVCMRKTERTVFGTSLYGELLRRDVPQITVSFSDHRFYSPAASEEEARKGLKDCLYRRLVERALEGISECKTSLRETDAKRHSLRARLLQVESARKAAGNEATNRKFKLEKESLEQKLRENEHRLMQEHCSGPEECIEALCGVLASPEHHIRLHQLVVRIDRLGVKREEPGARAAEIPLAEMELSSTDRRVVLLGRLPPIEFGAMPDLITEAGRYLGI